MGRSTSHMISRSAQRSGERKREEVPSASRVIMSRAFVKDLDDTIEELPDRPISPHPNLVTAEGLARIETEVARLQQEHAAVHAANDRAALARVARDLRYWTARRA